MLHNIKLKMNVFIKKNKKNLINYVDKNNIKKYNFIFKNIYIF